jgi:hypothetical protein
MKIGRALYLIPSAIKFVRLNGRLHLKRFKKLQKEKKIGALA